jgi:hypothetical protein
MPQPVVVCEINHDTSTLLGEKNIIWYRAMLRLPQVGGGIIIILTDIIRLDIKKSQSNHRRKQNTTKTNSKTLVITRNLSFKQHCTNSGLSTSKLSAGVRLRRQADAKMTAWTEMSVCVGGYFQRSDVFCTCKCFLCYVFLFLLNEQVPIE